MNAPPTVATAVEQPAAAVATTAGPNAWGAAAKPEDQASASQARGARGNNGGGVPFFSHDGDDSARSGPVSHNQSTYLQVVATGPATLGFWWRVDEESRMEGKTPGFGNVDLPPAPRQLPKHQRLLQLLVWPVVPFDV